METTDDLKLFTSIIVTSDLFNNLGGKMRQ